MKTFTLSSLSVFPRLPVLRLPRAWLILAGFMGSLALPAGAQILDQVIVPEIDPLPNRTVGDFAFDIVATSVDAITRAPTGLGIVYSIIEGDDVGYIYPDTGRCYLYGTLGKITIAYDQPGGANPLSIVYNPATRVTQSFFVQENQSIFVNPLAIEPIFLGDFVYLTASASSGLPVTFTIIEGMNRAELIDDPTTLGINDVIVPYLRAGFGYNQHGGAGPIRLRITQAGNNEFAPAQEVFVMVNIRPATQQVYYTVPPPENVKFGSYPFAVSANTRGLFPEGGGRVFYDLPAAIQYEVSSGPGYVLPGTSEVVTIGAGQVVVRAFEGFDFDGDGTLDFGGIDVNADGYYDFNPNFTDSGYVSLPVNVSTGASFLDQWTWRNPDPTGEVYHANLFANSTFVTVGEGGRIATSTLGEPGTWTVQNTAGGESLYALAYSSGRWVAGGEGGVVYTSFDTVTWTLQASGLTEDILGLTYDFNNGQFTAVGANGLIATSITGVAWATHASGVAVDLQAVTTFPGGLVAVGDAGTVLTSVNGSAWTVQISGLSHALNGVYYNAEDQLLVAVGGVSSPQAIPAGTIFTSTDGITWTARYSSTTIGLEAVHKENGYYVAVGRQGKVMTSRDAIVWTERSTRFLNDLMTITFGRGFFVAAGNGYSIFTTPTGQAWSLTESSTPQRLNRTAYNPDQNLWVSVGDDGLVLRSTDSVTWTPVVSGTTADLRSVVFADGHFVVVGGQAPGGVETATILFSTDETGTVWTALTAPANFPLGTKILNDVVYSEVDQQFVAVGNGYTTLTSPDGLAWTSRTGGSGSAFRGVTYAADLYVYAAVGDNGTVAISADGSNWTLRPNPTNQDLYSVAYSPELGLFVAVGAAGTIVTSTYGDFWTDRESGTEYDIYSVAYQADELPAVGGTFVAVGDVFQVLTSRDGASWTYQISGNLNGLFGVSQGGGVVLAVGDHQTIIATQVIQPSGLDRWRQPNPFVAAGNLNDIAYGDNTYVAVGNGGLILWSEDGQFWNTVTPAPTTKNLKSVVFGAGRFVAIGENVILQSTKGKEWDLDLEGTLDGTWLLNMNSITFGKGRFVVVGDQSQILSGSIDPDLPERLVWILGRAPVKATAPNLYAIAFGRRPDGTEMFVASGERATIKKLCPATGRVKEYVMTTIFWSDDSFIWTQIDPTILEYDELGCPIFETHTCRDLFYGNGYFVGMGDALLSMYWDGDVGNPFNPEDTGTQWNRIFAANDLQPALLGLTYSQANGVPRWVVVGGKGSVLSSADGFSYETRFPGIAENLNAVTFGDQQYVAVGDNGRLLFSADGTDWKTGQRSAGAIDSLNCAAYGNSVVVIAGDNGSLYRSTDGIAWDRIDSALSTRINGLAYGNSRFIAVGDLGKAVVSTDDGQSWSPSPTPGTINLYDVTYRQTGIGLTPRLFVAVGESGTILTTVDGTTWTFRSSPSTDFDLSAITGAEGAEAEGLITFNAQPAAGQTLTVNGSIFTFVAAPAAFDSEITIGLTSEETASNAQTVLSKSTLANVKLAAFVVNGLELRVVSKDAGPAGAFYTLATDSPALSLSGPNLTGGFSAFVAVGNKGYILRSYNGTTWANASGVPANFKYNLLDVAYGDGLFVAVGTFGQALTSTDGENWTVRNSGTNDTLHQVYHGSAGFVAAGTNGTILTSRDGVTWIRRPSSTPVVLLGGVYADGLHVTTGSAGTVLVSGELMPRLDQSIFFAALPNRRMNEEPFALSATASSGLPVYYSVASGQSIARLVGNIVILATDQQGSVTIRGSQPGNSRYRTAQDVFQSFRVISSDHALTFDPVATQKYGNPKITIRAVSNKNLPITYRLISGPATLVGDEVTFKGAGLVEIQAYSAGDASNGPASADLQIQVEQGDQQITFADLPTKNFGDPAFSISATASSGLPVSFILLSGPATLDGNTVTLTGPGTVSVRATQSGNNDFKAAPDVDRSFLVTEALPGNAWQVRQLTSLSLTGNQLLSVAYLNRDFFVAADQFQIFRSQNGLEWTADSLKSTGTAVNRGLAFGNGVYVAVGSGSELPTLINSFDGNNWFIGVSPVTVPLRAVAFANGRFVAVGDADTIITSTDGLVWSTVRTAGTGDFYDITYGDSGFVAVGGLPLAGDFTSSTVPGFISTSPDGLTWTNLPFSLPDRLFGVAFGGGLYTVVGHNFTIWTSEDAQTWFVRSSGTVSLRDVTYGNGRFVAVGDGGNIWTSGDGISWIQRQSNTSVQLNGVAYTDNIFVAVGADGTLLYSGSITSKADQTITVVQPVAQIYKTPSLIINLADPLTSAGLPVHFTVLAGSATVQGNLLTITGAGPIQIRATQDGDSTFFPASPKIIAFDVERGTQLVKTNAGVDSFTTAYGIPDLELTNAAGLYVDSSAVNNLPFLPFAVDSISDSPTGLPLTYSVTGPAQIIEQVLDEQTNLTARYLRITGEGTVQLTVSQVGNANYRPTAETGGNKVFTINVAGRYPTGNLERPRADEVFSASSAIYIQGSAVDTGLNAGIAKVEFFANGTKIGDGIKIANTSTYYLNSWIPGISGIYDLTMLVTDIDNYGSFSQVPTTITVQPASSQAPTISVNDPGTLFTGTATTLSVTTGDPDGVVTEVSFSVNGTVISTDTTPPFTAEWIPSLPGYYYLYATAKDNTGNVRTSDIRAVTVSTPTGAPPSAVLLRPVLGDSVTTASVLRLLAGASDSDGTLTTVQFYVNGNPLPGNNYDNAWGNPITGQLTTYSKQWTPSGPGLFRLQVSATDNSGNRVVSPAVDVTVTAATSLAPGLTFAAVGPFTLGGSAFLTGTAVDTDGQVTAGQFSVNLTPLTAEFRPVGTTFSQIWAPDAPGRYLLGLYVKDNTGNIVEAEYQQVAVTQAPTFSLDLAVPAIIPLGSDILVQATPSNVTGSIQEVQFYVDGKLLATDTVAPYSTVWTPTSLGAHSIIGIARDSSNNLVSKEITAQVTARTGLAPTLSVAITADGNLTENSSVIASASVADDKAGTTVAFYLNGEEVPAQVQSPFSARLQPVTLTDDKSSSDYRKYELRVVATDSDGNTRAVVLNQVYSANLFVSTPQIFLDAPKADDTLTNGLPFTLRARVQGSGTQDVSQVIFYANGIEIGSATSEPYTLDWTPLLDDGVPNKDIVITAAVLRRSIVWDANPDNIAELLINVTPVGLSSDTLVHVTRGAAGQQPTVSILEPANNSVFTRGNQLEITASADDADGKVSKVDFFANGILLATLDAQPYRVNWAPAASGSYNLTAVATDNAGNSTTSSIVKVDITAPVNLPPTVVLTSPVSQAVFTSASTVLVTAGAVDADGAVTQVEFYINGVRKTTDLTYPYTYAWLPGQPGTYRLAAVARDNDGNVIRSTPVEVTVNPATSSAPPANQVVLTNPGTVEAQSLTTLQASASDTDGIITQVEFFANGVSLGVDTTEAFSFNWTPLTSGTYILHIVATDNTGNTTVSDPVTVLVTKAANRAPVVALLEPSANATYTLGSTLALVGAADDIDGVVASVEFILNGNVASTKTEPPYEAIFTPGQIGQYVIQLAATDNVGNRSVSAPRTITITAPVNQTPYISVQAFKPAELEEMTSASNTMIFTRVIDPDNNIDSVEFFVNGESLGTVSEEPYWIRWSPGVPGRYVVSALAIDADGNRILATPQLANISTASGRAPTITVDLPSPASPMRGGTTVLSASNVSDPDGVVKQVVFFLNEESVNLTDSSSPYAVTWIPPEVGNYTLMAYALDNQNNFSFSNVRLVTVVAGATPVVDVVRPLSGTFTLGSSFDVVVTASDVDNAVQAVRIKANGATLASFEEPPYTFTWTPPTAGVYSLTAEADDESGNRDVSVPRVITIAAAIGQAPDVSIISPEDDEIFTSASTVWVEAGISDPDENVTVVEFFLNGTLKGQATEAPYALRWVPGAAGAYSIVAKATDGSGNVVTSKPVKVTATPAIGRAPTVDVTTPGTIILGAVATLSAVAEDSDGSIRQVEFYIDGETSPAFLDSVAPYSVNWQPTAKGTYIVTAMATDNRGNMTVSTFKKVIVTENSAPVVAIVNPANDSQFTLGSSIPVKATVTDDGVVTSVEFFIDGVSLARLTEPPYDTVWTPAAIGPAYKITAVATDNAGASSVSATITVKVNPPEGQAPSVAILSPQASDAITSASKILIWAGATDPDGQVVKVDFYANGALLASDTSFPYTFAWTPGTTGKVRLTAIATDDKNNPITSVPVEVTVLSAASQAPTVSLNPVADFTLGNAVFLSGQATDSDGQISLFRFLVNGQGLSAPTPPAGATLRQQWIPTAIGTYLIAAEVVDNTGNVAVSEPIIVKVNPGSGFTLSMINPTQGEEVRLGSDIIIEANPTGYQGAIKSVDFYVNNILVGTDAIAPYTALWTPTSLGNHTILAVARDLADTETEASVVVPVTELVGRAPSLAVSLTADGNITENSEVIVYANVYDDKPGTSVSYFLNGRQVDPERLEIKDSEGRITGTTILPFIRIQPTVLSDERFNANYRTYEIRVVATDTDNNTRATILNKVYVSNRFVNLPQVTLDTPKAGNELKAGLPVTMSVSLLGSGSDSVVKVLFYANGVEIGSSSSTPFTFQWTPTLTGTELEKSVRLTAAALRSPIQFDINPLADEDEFIDTTPVALAGFTDVKIVADSGGLPPSVRITSPDPLTTNTFSTGDKITFAAEAYADTNRTITQVEFFRDNFSLGIDKEAPYQVEFVPTAAGEYLLRAVASSNNGKSTESEPLTIRVIVGGVPKILSFTTDAVYNQSYVDSPIGFTVTAEDKDGIRAVHLFRDDIQIASDVSAPFAFVDTPHADYDYVYYAVVENVNGTTASSKSITIVVRYPDPIRVNGDFAYVSFNDLLFRVPTFDERSYYAGLISSNPPLDRESLILEYLDLAEYDIVRQALMARWLFTAKWPDRVTLSQDVNTILYFGFERLVETLEPELSAARLSGKPLPDQYSLPTDIRLFLIDLWKAKYGVDITESQLDTLVRYFNLYNRSTFLAFFILDVHNIKTGVYTITPIFGIAKPPNDRLPAYADAASLLINLLRATAAEVTAQFATQADKEPVVQIREIFASQEYKDRFASPLAGSATFADGWKYSNWFGFYYDAYTPWLYHSSHGWMYLIGQSPMDLWLYNAPLGWLWTNDYSYPFVYRQSDRQWLWYQPDSSSPRVFWKADGTTETF